MMNENLDWTNQLGAAVLAQQPDVMSAIQRQRAKAQSLGNLQTTAQQQVVTQDQSIEIVPADPQVIYVPVYDPAGHLCAVRAADVALHHLWLGFAMGAWLTNDCDWNHRGIYVNNWGPGGWHGYNRNVNITINNNYNYWEAES